MQEFTTAVKEVTGETIDEIKFKIDNREVTAYQPQDGQLAMLLASIGRGSSETDKIAGAINFFVAILSEPDAAWIEVRLLDRKDDFGIQQVEEVMEWLVEQWSGRPTKSLSVSTPSPESTGPSSTPTTPVLTSSGSDLIGS
jgi:hypothetical protein